ncbi:MAG TPA: hypothetical protein VKR06_10800, partial [Ktedonosporobacter sp.]|nr:hypothetical protein [Ktedonosporobacter sp.]
EEPGQTEARAGGIDELLGELIFRLAKRFLQLCAAQGERSSTSLRRTITCMIRSARSLMAAHRPVAPCGHSRYRPVLNECLPYLFTRLRSIDLLIPES